MEPLFNKSTTALVVIDLQKGIVAAPAEPYSSAEIISNTIKIADAVRANNMPVFLVRVTPSADGKDRLSPITDSQNTWSSNSMPADRSQIVPELGPKEGDFIITKRQWGAFYGTELDLQLRRRKIDTILLCGISTSIGVESTARYAFELGYNQIFIEDAMGARTSKEHQDTIQTTFSRIGRTRKTADILAEFK